MDKKIEQKKNQPSPVIGSTRLSHRGDTFPRLVQIGDVAYAQNKNNDRIIAAHYYGGLHEDSGEVKIGYYGMSAFHITTPKGQEIFIDPWKNPCDPSWGGIWFGNRMPMTHCDIGLVTHSHFDNNAYEMLDAGLIMRGMTGKYSFADVKITGLADKHIAETESEVYTREVMEVLYPFPKVPFEDRDNTIYVIETGGLKIVHWGHNRQNPPEDIWEQLQDVDIAILPVTDDGRQLTPEWADRIAEKMNAKVVIPCHYFIEGINIENHGWGKASDGYTLAHEHTVLQDATITVSSESIKDHKQHVMYFGGVVNFEKLEHRAEKMTDSVAKVPEVKPVWENA